MAMICNGLGEATAPNFLESRASANLEQEGAVWLTAAVDGTDGSMEGPGIAGVGGGGPEEVEMADARKEMSSKKHGNELRAKRGTGEIQSPYERKGSRLGQTRSVRNPIGLD